MKLFLLEPAAPGPAWAPFAGVRPICELRAGAHRIRERWTRLLGIEEVAAVSPATPGFADVDAVPLVDATAIVGPAVVATSTFAPTGGPLELPAGTTTLESGGTPVAWILAGGQPWNGPPAAGDPISISGLALAGAADLITACERLLAADCAELASGGGHGVPPGSIVLGDPAAVIVRTRDVEPHVIFDTRKGPVILEAGAMVRAGTRLEGPLYVGPHSWVLGGAVRQSVIGPHCRVHGEVSSTVFLGYANKSHDGFVGHSVLGHWVNLGAGTITSNLKNTYGSIRLELPGGPMDTGRSFLGSLIGDHAKTGIGTLLSTGTVIGAGANVLGNPVPRAVRPFVWSGETDLTAEGFLTVARRVLPRRGVAVSPEIEMSLRALHQRLAR